MSELGFPRGPGQAECRCQLALGALVAGAEDLGAELTEAIFEDIMGGRLEAVQIAGLLAALATRGETANELRGAVAAMRRALIEVPVARDAIDTCGTGGSGVARRNVSTAAALVLAGCGVAVAKHGNRAASSRSGSADVLEALGVRIDASPHTVARCVDEVGVGFLFARSLHPAMGHAAPVRRALGVPTIFNLLGPLTNPARCARQVVGVYDPSRVADMAGALGALGSARVFVVHGYRHGAAPGPGAPWGIDDLSPEGVSVVAEWRDGALHHHRLRPEDAGLEPHPLEALAGGDPAHNAAALRRLLDGDRAGELAAYRQAVIYAAALGIVVAGDGPLDELPAAARRARAALDDGRAREALSRLVEMSHDGGHGELP